MQRHEVEVGDCVQIIDTGHALNGSYAEVMSDPVLHVDNERHYLGIRLIPSAATGYIELRHLRWIGRSNMVRSIMINKTGRENWAPRMIIDDRIDNTDLLIGGTVINILADNGEPEPTPEPETGGAGATSTWADESANDEEQEDGQTTTETTPKTDAV